MSTNDIIARIPDRWGKQLYVGPGWYDIIVELNEKIAALDPNYTIAQVKEKFAGLRYYLHTINPEVSEQANELIREAEDRASKTCDICGGEGSLVIKGYTYMTRCSTHAHKFAVE